MRRIIACVLCVLLLCLTGCVVTPSEQPEPSPPSSPTDYSAEFADKWCYGKLSDDQKQNYAAVYAALKEGFAKDTTVTLEDNETVYGETVTLPVPVSDAKDIERVHTAIVRDNPDFFYLGSTYSYEGYHVGETKQYKTLYLTYTMDAAARAKAKSALDAAAARMLAAVEPLKTQYEKELWLHDMLLEQCEYNQDAAKSTSPLTEYPHDFTAYGALVNGKAVCEGYAYAMQLLLSRAGIASTPISGYDDQNTPHMWNLVKVDGGYYYLDATWNDQTDHSCRLYFNITTEDLLLSHTLDEENFGVEECTDTAANFFHRSGRYVTNYDREKIAALVAEGVDAGETCIELRFEPDKYTNARLFINNTSWFTSMVEEQMVTGHMWEYKYELAERYHVISIYKK